MDATGYNFPRVPETPPVNVSSLLYRDTAHFYWSFDGAQQLSSRAHTGENFYSPWFACNTTGYMSTNDKPGKVVRIQNTGTTSSINRCEKWPPLQAHGYFDLLVENGPVNYVNTQGQNLDLYNADATMGLCSRIQMGMYDPTLGAALSVYYDDLVRGLFDGNCHNQEPCPRMDNTEDCMVFNLDPTITDENQKDCIYIGNFDTNPEKFWQEKCLVNPAKCEDNGFTMSMWIKYNYTWLIEPGERFLAGTDYGAGHPSPNVSYSDPGAHPVIGWSLWHYTSPDGEQYIRVIVTDVNYLYLQDIVVVDASSIIFPMTDDSANTFWTNIGFRWKRALPSTPPTQDDYYIDVFIFGRQCNLPSVLDDDPGCIRLPNMNSTGTNVTGVYPVFSQNGPTPFLNATGIYIGCQGDPWGQNKLHFTSAVIDDVAFWAWRLRDEEIPYLLGGKAMPKTNIDPNRVKSVDVLPEPVNPFYAMADIFYKVYKLDFQDPSDPSYRPEPYFIKDVEPLMSPPGLVNPKYAGRNDPRSDMTGLSSDVLEFTYATQLLNSSAYIYVDPRLGGSGIISDCPHSLDTCSKGFSLSVWVFIPATASLRIMNYHYTIMRNIYQSGATENDRIAKTWELYTLGNRVFIRIGSADPVQFPGDCTPMLGRWTNLAFTWRADLGAQAYVNGLSQPATALYDQLSSPTVMGSPAVIPNIMDARSTQFRDNDIIIGSDGYLSSSLAGMAFNDLAIWRTYMHPFESYKFLGLSENEAVVLWNSSAVWTADYFVVRDRALYWEKIGGMWLYPDTGVITINIEDTDLKGHTVKTTNTTNGFLGFRDPISNTIFFDLDKNCLGNPGACDATGASYGGFFYVSQDINHPGRTYILTSGNVDDHCVGVALWLEVDTVSVPHRVLFAELSRFSDYNVNNGKTANYAVWRIGIPGIELEAHKWYHFAMTWSMQSGLFVFINGVAKGWTYIANIVGVDSITDAKPMWRYDNRAFMGVNSFYNGIMSGTGFMSYQTLAVYNKLFKPYEIPKQFGLIENPWFGTATIWFDKFHLISNWQQPLYDIRQQIANGTIDAMYGQSFEITIMPLSARFDKPGSIAPLLVRSETQWKDNMTIAIWVKINEPIPGQLIFSTDKYIAGYGGVVIRTTADGLDTTGCGTLTASGVLGTWAEVLGKWTHIAVSFNDVGGTTTCWLNGVKTIATYQYPAPLVPVTGGGQTEGVAVFTVGGIDTSVTGYTGQQDFEIYQLAIYPIATSDFSELGVMMGMPQQEAVYWLTGTYYWSFDGPIHDLFVPSGSLTLPEDASFEIDRNIQGYSVKTVASSKSCVNLGNFAGTCLTNVTMCSQSGFVLSMWIKLADITSKGYIFSTGAQQDGEPGLFVAVDSGILKIGVSNGKYLWLRERIYIAVSDVWFNLMFTWSPTAGLDVYINGNLQTDDVAITSSKDISKRNLMYLFTDATIGCANSDMSTVIPVYVDDIWFNTNASKIPLSTDDCPSSAIYRNVFLPQMLDQTETVKPYNPIKKSMATPVFQIIYPTDWTSGTAMDTDKQCPGDLSQCPHGFTVSFWFLLPSLKQFSRALLQLRSSSYQGLHVYLDNQNLQQSLRIEVRNQTHSWLVTVADYIDVNKWLQLTIAWDTNQVTVYTLNRQYAPVYARPSSGSGNDWTNTYSAGVTLDSGVWQYFIEDLNIWDRYLGNLKAYPMGVSCVAQYTDFVPDDLPTPPVLEAALSVAGICYLTTEDGKTCIITKEQWDRGAVKDLSSADYFKILTMLKGKGVGTSNVDDLGISKYQPQVSVQDLLSVKKQIMNGAIMTLTDRTKHGLSKTAYDFVQLCSSVLYPIRSKETWEALAAQGDSAMSVAEALDVFGGKVIENLIPVPLDINDTMNLNNSIDIHSDNIIFTAEVFPPGEEEFIHPYTFPNYDRIKLQSKSYGKKWGKDDVADKIEVPADVLNRIPCKTCSGKQRREKIKVVANLYDTMSDVVPPSLDPKSDVYRSEASSKVEMISKRMCALKFDPAIPDVEANDIGVTLGHSKDVPEGYMTMCAWYTEERTWDTSGCKVVNSSAGRTICSCSHLTNFAVLMQPAPIETPPLHGLILSILSYVGVIISMLSLMSLFYLLVTKHKLKSERTTIHINLCIALFLANLFFLFTGPAAYFRLFCRVCAAFMHFFYTATFMWLLMEGTYLFNAIVSGVLKGRLCCMIPLAWGVPVLVVAGVLAVNPEAYGGDDRCWLSFDRGFVFAFIGPIILIVILNAILLGLIVYNMPNTVLRRDTKFYSKVLRGVRHAAVLLPMFGVTWLFGLFAINESLIVFQYLFVIFNSLQGFFIFLGFGWFQPEVRRYMCARDDDDDDDDDPHKDVVNSESDLKTILATMPPPTPEMERKKPAAAASFATESETTAPQPVDKFAASARARTSFFRPATSLMRPKSAAPSEMHEGEYEVEEEDEEEQMKARELMEYLLDGKRVKDVPDFSAPGEQVKTHDPYESME